MTNLTHAHMNETCIPTVQESSVMQIKSSLITFGAEFLYPWKVLVQLVQIMTDT